ncbi:MAG: glycosyltransferase family 1 protein [Bacteroidota bacterium]|nr:glycosyltransferase family 1 protein [Bacteroidota bacterium]
MRIAVNTRLLIKNKLEGIGGFTFETLSRIVKQHPEHTFYFIFDRPYDAAFVFAPNVNPIVAFPQARHPLLYFIWFELIIPRILRRIKADLFLSPDGYLSLRSMVKQVVVMHDLNFEHYPHDLPFAERCYYRTFFHRYAQKAARIATVSEFSKMDIMNSYHIDDEKIDTVFNGANELFQPVPETEREQTRGKYARGNEYFICVGSVHPRKNIVNLLKAFELFKSATGSQIKLLIVGQRKWWTRAMQHSLDRMPHRSEVIFTGRVDNRELQLLIGSALALTYVSYHEGFGIPILESFGCDTPVITSAITSMPEVAGKAALLTDPFSPTSIAGAMERIYNEPVLREELIALGRERRKIFSWQKTADALWQCIEKAVV